MNINLSLINTMSGSTEAIRSCDISFQKHQGKKHEIAGCEYPNLQLSLFVIGVHQKVGRDCHALDIKCAWHNFRGGLADSRFATSGTNSPVIPYPYPPEMASMAENRGINK